jgi:hypothetical protein
VEVSNGGHEGNETPVERRPPAGPSFVLDERRPAIDGVVPVEANRPPRRRRSALLGGGLLIAASPAAVGAGLFVPGFAALGLGALLLLLPPTERRDRERRTLWRVVHAPATVVRRGVVEPARWIAHVVADVLRAVARFAATTGRDGTARIGRATLAWAAVVGNEAAVVGSRAWSAARVGAPRAWRGSVAAARSVFSDTQSATIRASLRIQPLLHRAAAVCLAGTERGTREIGAFASSASKRFSKLTAERPRALGRRRP